MAIAAVLLLFATGAHGQSLAERARPLVEASHAEIRAVYLGRVMSQGRWNEILDEALYTLAPKGRWGPEHPAWPAARVALAKAMREKSVVELEGETGKWVRDVINERFSLQPDQVAKAAEFYRSPGGQVFRDFREKFLAEASYGLPYVIETKLYDVASEKLLWTGISETLNPESASKGIDSVGRLVVSTLRNEGVIAK